VRTIYITPDGRAKAEKTRLFQRLIEEPDGYHPVNPEAIWHDDQRRKQPLMVIWNMVINPQGSKLPEEAVKGIERECEIIKRCRRKQSISRIWGRMLERAMQFLSSYGIMLLVFILIASVVIRSMMGG
jgi:hypothetical protein